MSKVNSNRSVVGEASESEDEEQDCKVSSGVGYDESMHRSSLVVEGEADETESEDEEATVKVDEKTTGALLTSSVMSQSSRDETHQSVRQKVKYKTLLHKKLRDRNEALARHIFSLIHMPYANTLSAIKHLSSEVLKCQQTCQDVSHHMRLLSNTLFMLEDKTDIIVNCSLLPNIRLPEEAT